jgi:hypothetical protein
MDEKKRPPDRGGDRHPVGDPLEEAPTEIDPEKHAPPMGLPEKSPGKPKDIKLPREGAEPHEGDDDEPEHRSH